MITQGMITHLGMSPQAELEIKARGVCVLLSATATIPQTQLVILPGKPWNTAHNTIWNTAVLDRTSSLLRPRQLQSLFQQRLADELLCGPQFGRKPKNVPVWTNRALGIVALWGTQQGTGIPGDVLWMHTQDFPELFYASSQWRGDQIYGSYRSKTPC